MLNISDAIPSLPCIRQQPWQKASATGGHLCIKLLADVDARCSKRLRDIDSSRMSARNPGTDFDASWFENIHINLPAVKRRAETYGTRRTVKKQWQAAWLLRAVSCIDLTTLAGDDTPSNVARLPLVSLLACFVSCSVLTVHEVAENQFVRCLHYYR